MMKKKILSSMLVLSMVAGMSVSKMPVFAADGVTETQSFTEAKPDAICDVTINGGSSSFSVTIPKTITGSGESGTLGYTVTVQGDFAGDEQVVVTPDSSVTLKQDKKNDVTASITQDKTKWACNELETVGNGEITYQDVKAGTYEGTFNFAIGLKDVVSSADVTE